MKAMPRANPRNSPLGQLARRSHREKANRAVSTRAAQAISRAANPAWAKIGGKVVKSAAVQIPASPPLTDLAHSEVIRLANIKKGNMPNLAKLKLFS